MKDQEHHRIYRDAVARQGLESKLRKPEPVHPIEIVLNLEDQAIEFEDRYGTVGRILFGGETVLYEGQPLLLQPKQPPQDPIRKS